MVMGIRYEFMSMHTFRHALKACYQIDPSQVEGSRGVRLVTHYVQVEPNNVTNSLAWNPQHRE